MKILIIGGTKFVGRHLAIAASTKGHEVTIFHRGNHPLDDLKVTEEILGDRNSDLDKIAGRDWDAVIDTCGYLPQHVDASADTLKNNSAKYVFISSISAYADHSKANFDEDAPLAKLTPEQLSELNQIDPMGDINAYQLGTSYGGLKVLCEQAATRIFPDNHLIIRPGLIVGEYDWTDRFTYWVMRTAKGGEVFAPGKPDGFVQFIDAKDIAEWTVRMIENDETGIYNATGKPNGLTFGEMLYEMKRVIESDAEFTWVDDQFMTANGVAPWTDMPVFLPETDDANGFAAASIEKALGKGLRFRDLKETITKTLNWRTSVDGEMKAGISSEREVELLAQWHIENPR